MADKDFTLSKEYLQSIFEYKDGKLYWKIRPANCVKIGDEAGCLDSNKYYKVRINKKMYGLHRIIYAMHYGYFPKMIDHIDGNEANNKIENLRNANDAQNQWNTRKNIRNTSGFKNVYFRKSRNFWVCQFQVNKQTLSKGGFKTAEEASVYAEKLRKELHGEFASLQL
jgi:hypothetical protein